MARIVTPQCPNGIPMTDPRFLIPLGVYEGITASNHFGSNPVVGTSYEIIREAGGGHTWLSAAAVHDVTSSSTNDTSDGTGIRTVLLTGLDANYNVITETVTMNGTTTVNTSASFLRINEAHGVSAGSNETNVGDIYITETGGAFTAGVPDDLDLVQEKIPVGFTQSESTIFTIPAGFTFYTHSILLFAAANKTVTFRECIRHSEDAITTVLFEGVAQDTEELIQRGAMPIVEEKHSIFMQAKVNTGSAEVSAAVDGWLVNNTLRDQGWNR